MNAAQSMNARQREADRAHHLARLAWLETEAPRYTCGQPVAPSDKAQMIKASRDALALIENHGMSTGHARIEPQERTP